MAAAALRKMERAGGWGRERGGVTGAGEHRREDSVRGVTGASPGTATAGEEEEAGVGDVSKGGHGRGGAPAQRSTGMGTACAERLGPHPVAAVALGKRRDAGGRGRERGGSPARGSTGAGAVCTE